MVKHVVMFSGGITSWAAARRVTAAHGKKDVTLLFTDTLIEDEDCYRFLDEAAANIGLPIVKLAEGRDVWQVFHDERFLGNSRIDPCSRILKREMADRYMKQNFDPADTVRYVGIDWTEAHRYERLKVRLAPWKVEAPLCEPPFLTKQDCIAWATAEGLEPPRLYSMGFSHNNCGGFCIKAGQGHFALLYKRMPERYAYHEQKEQEMREYLGRDISILSEERNGEKHTLTLQALRERIEKRPQQVDFTEIGGCGCFID
jgi:hypothetical protein